VEYGSQCFCANSITVSSGGGSLAATSDCNMACTGDSSQTCGAGDRIFIYSYAPSSTTTSATTTTTSSTPSSTWTSLGCYGDSSNRVLAAYSTSSGSMTTGLCQSTCSGRGYSYAGTEYSMSSLLGICSFLENADVKCSLLQAQSVGALTR
jgi:glucan endo-1,3-alpha-glucosidase